MLFHITSKHNYQTCGTTTGEGQSPEYNRWVEGNDKVTGITIKTEEGKIEKISTDCVLGFFGLIMKLGPIAEWGLNLEKKNNTSKYRKFSNK